MYAIQQEQQLSAITVDCLDGIQNTSKTFFFSQMYYIYVL